MLSTTTSYQLITRDLSKSLQRIEKQPLVKRETAYFQANIGSVKSAEDFVADTRLFNYAMKAFGLQDMAYAKAFILKALKEGVSDPDSFANRLADKRYAEFVKVFDFAAYGEKATTYNLARDATIDNYVARFTANGELALTETRKQATEHFRTAIGEVKTVEDLLADEDLLAYALRAYSLEGEDFSEATLRAFLEGGVEDPESPANRHANENVAKFVTAFDFAALGERTTTHVPVLHDSVANYMRQTLEEDAGNSNEGVRLALYFERKAPDITSFYQILGDPALASVVRTALGLPDSIAQSDLDRQVALFEKRLDIEDFTDPERLGKFLKRFTAMWELGSPSAGVSPAVTLLSQPPQLGVSVDTMMAIAMMKK